MNHLQSDIDSNANNGENDDKSIVQLNSKSGNEYSQEGEEGEYGEGESYTSSWSWSSWLRERNADNGVSLKLSQYSYKPTVGPVQRNESEDSGMGEHGDYYEDDVALQMTQNDQTPVTPTHGFQDNLNNGTDDQHEGGQREIGENRKYKMKLK